jgi:cytochrome c peroxidase
MSQRLLPLSVLLCLALIGCQPAEQRAQDESDAYDKPLTPQEEKDLHDQAMALFGVLPDVMPGGESDGPELVALGEKLYHDVRLSVNDQQSCNTCHRLDEGRAGVDNEPTSAGALGERGDRNSPTVLNAGFHFAQFWDGRAGDLLEQAKGPILNPIEMGMPSADAVVAKLRAIPEYRDLFAKAFPKTTKPITYDNVAGAIAAFERTLVSRSRYDDWIGGDHDALSPREKRGLTTFIHTGCIACHMKATFGGTSFQQLGAVNEFITTDPGRFLVTKDPMDSMMFKVPSLRNVTRTAPYFHNGSVPTLEKAIELMAWHQLGKKVTPEEIDLIVAFLASLADKRQTPKT